MMEQSKRSFLEVMDPPGQSFTLAELPNWDDIDATMFVLTLNLMPLAT